MQTNGIKKYPIIIMLVESNTLLYSICKIESIFPCKTYIIKINGMNFLQNPIHLFFLTNRLHIKKVPRR